jgi:hypothetical protein
MGYEIPVLPRSLSCIPIPIFDLEVPIPILNLEAIPNPILDLNHNFYL